MSGRVFVQTTPDQSKVSERFKEVCGWMMRDFVRADRGDAKLRELVEVAKNFEEWKKVEDLSLFNEDLKQLALQKMFEVATSFAEYRYVYVSVPKGHELKARALRKMSERVDLSDSDQLIELSNQAPRTSQEFSYACQRLADLHARLVEECSNIAAVLNNQIQKMWVERFHE